MNSLIIVVCLFCALPQQQPELKQVVVEAFTQCHAGYSSDEVLLADDLNQKFIAACRQKLPDQSVMKFNWALINLRKAGKLKGIKTTKRNRESTVKFRLLAEIVARSMIDKEKVSIDRIFCDPVTRKAFDDKARTIKPDANLYLVRKAALQLRKARKLKPELITRIADWGRVIKDFPVRDIKREPAVIPEQPGIYIFHDDTGYLYIGQSENLRKRLTNHLDESSNFELADYLAATKLGRAFVEIHAFPTDSRAKEVAIRRAYESELIRSRKPKFNILP